MLKLWRNRWLRGAVLLVLLAIWVLVPHRWEGPVVWTITQDHGIHVSDLAGVVAAATALWLVCRVRPNSSGVRSETLPTSRSPVVDR